MSSESASEREVPAESESVITPQDNYPQVDAPSDQNSGAPQATDALEAKSSVPEAPKPYVPTTDVSKAASEPQVEEAPSEPAEAEIQPIIIKEHEGITMTFKSMDDTLAWVQDTRQVQTSSDTMLTVPIPPRAQINSVRFGFKSQTKLLYHYIDNDAADWQTNLIGKQVCINESVSGELLYYKEIVVIRTSGGETVVKPKDQVHSLRCQDGDALSTLLSTRALTVKASAPTDGDERLHLYYSLDTFDKSMQYTVVMDNGWLEFSADLLVENKSSFGFSHVKLCLASESEEKIKRSLNFKGFSKHKSPSSNISKNESKVLKKRVVIHRSYSFSIPEFHPQSSATFEMFRTKMEQPVFINYARVFPHKNRMEAVAAEPNMTTKSFASAVESSFIEAIEVPNEIALPRGNLRVFGYDPYLKQMHSSQLDAISEDDTTLIVPVGLVERVKVDRRRTHIHADTRLGTVTEHVEIGLRSQSPYDLDLVVDDIMFRSDEWTIQESSVEHKIMADDRVRFQEHVPKQTNVTITYVVVYKGFPRDEPEGNPDSTPEDNSSKGGTGMFGLFSGSSRPVLRRNTSKNKL